MSDRPFEATAGAYWGLVSRQNVPKPVYRAFELLKDAGDATMPFTTIVQNLRKPRLKKFARKPVWREGRM